MCLCSDTNIIKIYVNVCHSHSTMTVQGDSGVTPGHQRPTSPSTCVR